MRNIIDSELRAEKIRLDPNAYEGSFCAEEFYRRVMAIARDEKREVRDEATALRWYI